MRKLIYILFVFSTLYLVSCKSDNNEDPITPSTGDARDKYVGTWMCNEISQVINSSYTITISKSTTNSSEIVINKFYNLATQARASVAGNNITIPYQSLSSLGFASGTGTLATNGTNLALNYIVKIGPNPNDTCSANCVKQ
jgi:hypothetical protein